MYKPILQIIRAVNLNFKFWSVGEHMFHKYEIIKRILHSTTATNIEGDTNNQECWAKLQGCKCDITN